MLPRLHVSLERWRKNEKYGVWVSTEGRIRLIKNKKLLENRIGGDGYCYVFTQRGMKAVHTIVAKTWLDKEYNETNCSVDHINSNKRDNSVRNLRWVPEDVNKHYANFMYVNSAGSSNDNIVIDDDLKSGKLIAYANGLPITYKDFLKCMPTGLTAVEFIDRVRKASYRNAKYCGYIWEIKNATETEIKPVSAPDPVVPAAIDSSDAYKMLAMFNEKLDERTRGRAAWALYRDNKIIIKADSFEFKNLEDFNKKREDLTGKIEPEIFIGRILKVANKLKTYCNHFWTVEAVTNQ